ncbi:MAG: STAS domain-containing protein [Flavobacteriales bacterium]|nr:STAS domain-containing protein [Flavobacteriales bacterium]
MSFSYNIKKDNDFLIVKFIGNLLSKEQALGLIEELENEFSNGYENVIIDLSQMQYLNSTGLNIFIRILTLVRNNGGDVMIANVPEKINKLLVVTKLNSVFNIVKTIEKAKEELIKSK